MASITVTKEIAAPAAKVWALLADFGNVSWIPMAGDVVVGGAGPGMRRRIQGGSGPIVERLVSIEPGERKLSYSIDENNPLPVKRYEATVSVSAAGEQQTAIRWDVSFDPSGDEGEAKIAIGAIYGMMATWLETAAKGAS